MGAAMRSGGWRPPRTVLVLACAVGLLTACAPAASVLQPTPAALFVEILHPSEGAEVVAGEGLRIAVQVIGPEGADTDGAEVDFTLRGSDGEVEAELEGVAGGQGVFRSPSYTIAVRAPGGIWSVEIRARQGGAEGAVAGTFAVVPSTSRVLHDKYGFWLDAPTLRGVTPMLAAERGDASNGMIRWGGSLPAAHILPSAWIDVQWRQGDFGLTTAESVRRFLLDQVGDLGASRVRSLGEPQPVRFKEWDGWLVPARAQLRYEQVEWLVFYAPEVDRAYALGTTIVAPPEGIRAHDALRRSFDVDAAWKALGVAPEPLPMLLPGPRLLQPGLGKVFYGSEAEIVLRWEPPRPLGEDEVYEVVVDYAYSESAPLVRYATRATQLTLPPELYQEPNCGVFNWTVRLLRSPGPDAGNGPAPIPISHPSFYSYVLWKRPASDPAPFLPLCPNEQT